MEEYGVNILVEKKKEYDMHCPLCITKGKNYYKTSCEYRQKNRPDITSCYGGCRAKETLARDKRMADASKKSGTYKKGRPAVYLSEADRNLVIDYLVNTDISYKSIQEKTGINRNKIGKIATQMQMDGIEMMPRIRGKKRSDWQ